MKSFLKLKSEINLERTEGFFCDNIKRPNIGLLIADSYKIYSIIT